MIKLDILHAHSDDMGEAVGHFYGTPIKEFFDESARLREDESNSRITQKSTSNYDLYIDELAKVHGIKEDHIICRNGDLLPVEQAYRENDDRSDKIRERFNLSSIPSPTIAYTLSSDGNVTRVSDLQEGAAVRINNIRSKGAMPERSADKPLWMKQSEDHNRELRNRLEALKENRAGLHNMRQSYIQYEDN